MRNCIIVTGQTATGKTALALDLAKKNNGELISIDSRQLYRDIDIVSGKDITKKNFKKMLQVPGTQYQELSTKHYYIGYYTINGIKVWLYDTASLDQVVSSFTYKNLVSTLLKDHFDKNKTPIFVGGTYLYIKSLLYGFETESIPPDENLRIKLNKLPVFKLRTILNKIDQSYFESLNNSEKNNPQRLIRKIEIKKFLIENRLKEVKPLITADKFIGLKHKTDDLLLDRITKRVGERIKNGAIEEIMNLHKKGYAPTSIGLTAIGCKQIIGYLAKQYSIEEMKEKWIASEVAYAKRQLQFMKTDKKIKWRTV